uniref:Uncharacterized protein n=1 Tax=Anguilla anguilla TaxID=7936 RepID=A0A0E9RZ88_ANGAN
MLSMFSVTAVNCQHQDPKHTLPPSGINEDCWLSENCWLSFLGYMCTHVYILGHFTVKTP